MVTMKPTNIFDKYRAELVDIELLTEEETNDLVSRMESDPDARDALIRGNLRLSIYIAKRYSYAADFEDLVAEGNTGLVHATYKFDPSLNTKFSTYAVFWIRKRILDYLRDQRENPAVLGLNSDEMEMTSYSMIQNPDLEPQEEALNAAMIMAQLDKKADKLIKLGLMKERDIQVFKARIFLEMSLKAIGEDFNITKQRVAQIEKKIHKLLAAELDLFRE